MALSAADRGARTGRRLTPATRAALEAGLTLREVSTPPKFPRLAPDARLTSEPQATLLCHPTLTGTPGQTSGFWQTPWLGAVCTFGGGGDPSSPLTILEAALSSFLLGFCNRLPGVSAQTDKQAAGDPVPTRPGRAHGQGQGLGSHSPSAPRPSWDSFRPGTRAGQSSWPGAGCAFDPSSCEVAVCLGRTSQGPVSSLPLGHLFWGGREAGDETAGPETAALRRGPPSRGGTGPTRLCRSLSSARANLGRGFFSSESPLDQQLYWSNANGRSGDKIARDTDPRSWAGGEEDAGTQGTAHTGRYVGASPVPRLQLRVPSSPVQPARVGKRLSADNVLLPVGGRL